MIKKIIDSIADDKKDHVLLGMFVGYPLMIIGYILDTSLQMDFMVISGAIVGIVLVAAKEIVHDGWLASCSVEKG